jgi:hypothetical protein
MLRGDGDHPCPSDPSQKIEYQARSRRSGGYCQVNVMALAGGCWLIEPLARLAHSRKNKAATPRFSWIRRSGRLELDHRPGFRVLRVEIALRRSSATVDDPWQAVAHDSVQMPSRVLVVQRLSGSDDICKMLVESFCCLAAETSKSLANARLAFQISWRSEYVTECFRCRLDPQRSSKTRNARIR